jgi:hypothetical protein
LQGLSKPHCLTTEGEAIPSLPQLPAAQQSEGVEVGSWYIRRPRQAVYISDRQLCSAGNSNPRERQKDEAKVQ